MRKTWIFVATALAWPCTLIAQQSQAIPRTFSRAELNAALKSGDPVKQSHAFAVAVDVLTGRVTGPGLTAEIVAADLVDIASSSTASDRARSDAVAALLRSRAPDKAQRYAGAAGRLMEIHRRSTDPGVRGIAMGAVVRVADPRTALTFLKPLAEHSEGKVEGEQAAAIRLIGSLDTQDAAAFLRDLHQRGVVTEESAIQALASLADKGYRSPPARRPPS